MKPHTDLTDLGVENLNDAENGRRLRYVLERLAAADELESGLSWSSVVWEGVTIEELLAALIEADKIHAAYEHDAAVWNGRADEAAFDPILDDRYPTDGEDDA